MVKNISILGSTGSIGTQTLEVVRYNKDIKVTALAAGSNVDLIEKQIREFKPEIACLWSEEKAKEIDEEIQRIIRQCHDQAREIISQHIQVLHSCAELIIQKD